MTHDRLDNIGMQQDIVDAMLDAVWRISANKVRSPTLPIMIYINEAMGWLAAADEFRQDLLDVAMPEGLVREAERRILALFTIQTQWNTARSRGRDEQLIKRIDRATRLRHEGLDMADLALRNNSEGKRRLSEIRKHAGLADLVADLYDLALLFRDAAQHFGDVKIDASMQADRLEQVSHALQDSLAQEKGRQNSTISKELRDRFYSYSLQPLKEIQAFARFAFRHDKGESRKQAFSSAYNRMRVRKHRAKKRADALNKNPQLDGTPI